MTTLDELKSNRPYPRYTLSRCKSALLVFGAGFLGRNDGIWVHEAGVADVTVVDIDSVKMEEMKSLYPDSWEFVVKDAFAFGGLAVGAQQWDLVSVDAPTNLSNETMETLPLWCLLSTRWVVLGVTQYTLDRLAPALPAGWRSHTLIQRSKEAFWQVFRHVGA